MDFLWARIGTHATGEGVNIDMSLTKGSGDKDTYNINFTAVGAYVGISEFIRDIEDDSNLAFKIEGFSMSAGESTSQLKATFVCKNIPIEGVSAIDTPATTTEKNGNNTTNNASTSNSSTNTDSSNTSNVTNSSNTATTSNAVSTQNTTTTNQ